MVERKDIVTMQGNPVTLEGNPIKVGVQAPDFEVVNTDLKTVKFSSFKGKPALIIAVPSLDTSVCNKESHRFNLEVAKFKESVNALVISMDLPFAQKRWCAAEGAMNLVTLSDYKSGDFGKKYGVLIKEVHLLARSIFIVDGQGIVRYTHICKEVATEPPYEEVLKQLQNLLSGVK